MQIPRDPVTVIGEARSHTATGASWEGGSGVEAISQETCPDEWFL